MNNSEILSLTFELKEEILKSEIYVNLKEKEKKMLNDEECFKLLNEFQSIQDEYNEAKRFEKYGSDLEKIQKKLSEYKRLVDDNKYVKEYNEAYKKMVGLLKNVQKTVFKDIVKEEKEITIE